MISIVRLYKKAREYSEINFPARVDFYRSVCILRITKPEFFRASATTVLGSHYKWTNIEDKMPALTAAFRDWNPREVAENSAAVRTAALQIFAHKAKIEGIIENAEIIAGWTDAKFEYIKKELADIEDPTSAKLFILQQFNFVGPVTVYNFARLIGLDMAKPDIWMERLAERFGYAPGINGVTALAFDCHRATGDRIGLIDFALWKFLSDGKYQLG